LTHAPIATQTNRTRAAPNATFRLLPDLVQFVVVEHPDESVQ
jgi:hypothetical protein